MRKKERNHGDWGGIDPDWNINDLKTSSHYQGNEGLTVSTRLDSIGTGNRTFPHATRSRSGFTYAQRVCTLKVWTSSGNRVKRDQVGMPETLPVFDDPCA